MIGGLVAFVFGIAEALMLKAALFSFTTGNYTKAVALVIIKLLLYGAGIALLVFVFPKALYACLIGFAAGLPLATVGWFIYYNFRAERLKSGDDRNESDNNN